jgi:uncharacterized damage-inducible protein DinB
MAQELKDVQKHWAASKEFTDAVAAAMPDENYGFKAADAEMSFGEMVVHIAQGNGSYCAAAAGAKSPIAKPAKIDKATAIALLDQSFEFCSTTIAGLQDLNKTAGRGMDVRELLWAGFTHTAHHRAQLEVYLRLKGIKPPDYKF